jgi:hypothetical protein
MPVSDEADIIEEHVVHGFIHFRERMSDETSGRVCHSAPAEDVDMNMRMQNPRRFKIAE